MERPDILNLKNNFLRLAQNVCPGFVIDEYNKQVIGDLFNYFTGQAGTLDRTRGIWLEGPIGTGKTTLLYIFSQFLILVLRRSSFRLYNTSNVVEEYRNGMINLYTTGFQCIPSRPVVCAFDELGREPAVIYRDINVMQYILNFRYTVWQREKLLTHITTNLDAEDIERRYGDFMRDRRREMFNIVPLVGPSRR